MLYKETAGGRTSFRPFYDFFGCDADDGNKLMKGQKKIKDIRPNTFKRCIMIGNGAYQTNAIEIVSKAVSNRKKQAPNHAKTPSLHQREARD